MKALNFKAGNHGIQRVGLPSPIARASNGFSAFQPTEHSGEVKGEGILNGAGTGSSVTYYYKAFPYTP